MHLDKLFYESADVFSPKGEDLSELWAGGSSQYAILLVEPNSSALIG
jgi:hypothetical protein